MTCDVCSRENDSRVCVRCRSRMRRQLGDLRGFFWDADKSLMPGKSGSGRSREIRIGVRLDALDFVAGFDVLPALEDWERDWRRFFDCSPFGPASIEKIRKHKSDDDFFDAAWCMLSGTISFLELWLDRACEKHPAIEDFSRELTVLWRQGQAAAGKQPRTSWNVTCPADLADGECGRKLRVTGEDFDGIVTCPGCKTSWKVERLLMVVASSKHAELWLDPDAAATWLGISARDLRRWAQAGRIKRRNNRYEVHSIRDALASA